MTKDLSVSYYQKKKERIIKKAHERYQDILKKKEKQKKE